MARIGWYLRQQLSAPLVADLEAWMREQRAKISRGNELAKAMDYMLKRWSAFGHLRRLNFDYRRALM